MFTNIIIAYTFVMEKIMLNLGALKEGSKYKKEYSNLYTFLVFEVLHMEIKKDFLYLKPNFKKINFLLEVKFVFKHSPYNFLIDGKNKCIVANNIKLCNINKIGLNYLKEEKTTASILPN